MPARDRRSHARKCGSTAYFWARPLLEALEGRIAPAIFNVGNTNDSGAGSLRQAILNANASPGADTIQFDLTVFATTQTITLTTGELLVSDDLTITGPGASILTVSGNNASRVFEFNAAGRVINVSLSGLTVTGGLITNGSGGGLYSADENVILSGMVIRANAAGTGGGIGVGPNGSLVLRNVTIASNTSAGPGGGIYTSDAETGSLLLDGSTIFGNVAAYGGGGIHWTTRAASSAFNIINSTISGNTADGPGALVATGGGIAFSGPVVSGSFTIQNSTISGNAADKGGGMYLHVDDGNAVIRNSTFTNNRTVNGVASLGDGIYKSGSATITLTSSIVSGNNTVVGSPTDISSLGGLITASYSAIGIDPGQGVLASPRVGNLGFGASLNLGPLANNGGPTQTHSLGAGSLAIDHGSNPSSLATDERGQPRVGGAAADIGAYESAFSVPAALTTVSDVTTSGGTSYVFNTSYIAVAGINVATLDSNDLRVTGPGGFNALATLMGVDSNTNGSPRIATYRFTAPGGSWDHADDGTYTVSMEPGQVKDIDGIAVLLGAVGSFRAFIPRTLVVTNANDSGAGSLRNALTSAGPTPDTITFDPTFFAVPRTIQLQSLLPVISDPLTITGPGATLLAIAGSSLRVAAAGHVSLSGMTVTRGQGVRIAGAAVTIEDMVISSNAVSGAGGGIAILGTPTVTVRNCTISGNTAGTSSSQTSRGGGGIYSIGGTLLVENCTISGNSTPTEGGGIYIAPGYAVNVTVRNTTIAGNTAGTIGGGIMTRNTPPRFPGPIELVVQNCTIANNQANGTATGQGGGGIGVLLAAGKVSIESTIVANNTNANAPDVLGAIAANYSLVRNQLGATINGSNNLPAGADPRLGPRQNNGGTTETIALLPGSPAINAGSNRANLSTDQRGAGFPRVFESAADIGAFEVQQATVPLVVVNVGQANLVQRSMVTSLTVTFGGLVTFTGAPENAFQLNRIGPGGTLGSATLGVDLSGSTATQTIARLTFSGPLTEGASSLIDGNYTLTTLSSQVNGGLLGGNYVSSLFRLFGDLNGDKAVNGLDLTAFRNSFGTVSTDAAFVAAFDFNGDGAINGTDLTQFRSRFGVILP